MEALNPSIDQTPGRTGSWAEDEAIKLEDAVHAHGGKNWAAIAAPVPGRTIAQCSKRWEFMRKRELADSRALLATWC
jgi:hypothetical protein